MEIAASRSSSVPGSSRRDSLVCLWLPAALFVLDPIVFKGSLSLLDLIGSDEEPRLGFLACYRFPVYLASAICLAVFLAWSFRRPAVPLVAGVFLAAAVLSFTVGCWLLRFTLPLAFAVIPLLGLTPFLVSFVYTLLAIRILRASRAAAGRRVAQATLAFLLALGIPAAAHVASKELIDTAVAQAERGDFEAARRSATVISYLHPMLDLDGVCRQYGRLVSAMDWGRVPDDPAKKEALAFVYQQATGEDIWSRAWLFATD